MKTRLEVYQATFLHRASGYDNTAASICRIAMEAGGLTEIYSLRLVQFLVDVGVAAAHLQELDRRVGAFVESRVTDFSGSHSVQLAACGDPLKVALSVGVEFSHNGVDAGKLGQARSDLLQASLQRLLLVRCGPDWNLQLSSRLQISSRDAHR